MADMRTIQKAWGKLREAGIDGVLVGTTALQLHGYDVEAPDIDFLTDGRRPPGVDESYAAGAPVFTIDGVKVDYIAGKAPPDCKFFHPERAVRIAGVPVAALVDVVGLKHWRGRLKDHMTLSVLGLHPDQQEEKE